MKYKTFSPDLWQKIQTAFFRDQERHSSPLACFDADGTLWDTDLGENFFKYEIQHKLLELPEEPWNHYRKWKSSGDPRPAYLWLAQIHKNLPFLTVQKWAKQAVESIQPLPLFEEQKKLIDWILKNGGQVKIVTASVKWAVEPAAHLLGLQTSDVIGVETLIQNQIVTDIPAGHMTYKEGKPEALLIHSKGQKPFFSCGNSTGDLHLLKAATELSLAVGAASPSDELFQTEEELRQAALQNKWEIHRFT